MDVKILPLFLVLALACVGWDFSYEAFDTNEAVFRLSNNPEESTAIALTDKSIIVKNLPKTDSFNYLMLKLVGEKNTLPVKIRKNARHEAYDAKFSLYGVPDGSYFIELYYAPEKYTTYVSYIRGQSIQIRIRGKAAYFVEPPVLRKNMELFASSPQGEEAFAGYLKQSEKVQSDNPVVIELAKTITAGINSDYDKAKAIHDWVCKNIWYDCDEFYSGIHDEKTVIETINSRRGVCVEYSSLTAALLRASGIPAKLVMGYTLNTSSDEVWTEELLANSKPNHIWNEAYIDGRWVIIDTTYDSNNTYKNKVFSNDTGLKNRKYFDITIELLSTDRRIASVEHISAEQ